FKKKVDGIHALGNEEIKQSASVSNRMLDRPVGALARSQDKSSVFSALLQLRRTVEDLDPSDRGLLDRRRLFGVLPLGNRLRDDCLFYVRQTTQDLATQLAVSAQGYLALELVRKNNLELVKGVDRATTTTVSALRTAVMTAQGLVNQKLVLDQIGALNETTADMIEGTSAMLRQQSAGVHEQAASATVSIEKLQAAFANIYATID